MTAADRSEELDGLAGAAGKILTISYPVLAISTAFRAGYQLFLKEGVTNYLGPSLSGIAALCYLLATVGFARRSRRAWWLSVTVLASETFMTLVVGTISLLSPDLIGSSVWRAFGADYGYFPLVQPILGLIWLLQPRIRSAYRIGHG